MGTVARRNSLERRILATAGLKIQAVPRLSRPPEGRHPRVPARSEVKGLLSVASTFGLGNKEMVHAADLRQVFHATNSSWSGSIMGKCSTHVTRQKKTRRVVSAQKECGGIFILKPHVSRKETHVSFPSRGPQFCMKYFRCVHRILFTMLSAVCSL